jgi:hypothetical protein
VSERWIPVLAAVVGVLGGMGGAFIGGYVANEGQEQRFQDEQEVRAQDLRRNAYADFLQAAADVQFSEEENPSENPVDKLIGAQAKAALFANSDVQGGATALVDAVRHRGDCYREAEEEEDCYGTAQSQFVDAAKAQLEAGD